MERSEIWARVVILTIVPGLRCALSGLRVLDGALSINASFEEIRTKRRDADGNHVYS